MRRKIIPYNPILKDRASDLRKRMTRAEVKLWREIKGRQILGYDFDRQRPIDEYIVDFYCKDLELAIEIDGITHLSESAVLRDRQRQQRLESLSVRFLRFSDDEVHADVDRVVSMITEWIRTHPLTPSTGGETFKNV